MRGAWASVVVAGPLVWVGSTLGHVPVAVVAVIVTVLAAVLIARESLRVESLEVDVGHLNDALRAVELERDALLEQVRTLVEDREELREDLAIDAGAVETWRTRATTLQTALDDARSSRAAFLATVSHELRTPLHAIIGFTELVSDGSAGSINDQQREFLGDARAAAHHLLRLITDVLDYAKSDAGRLSFTSETVQVAPLLRDVTSLLEGLAAKKRLTLTSSCEDDLTLLGDALRVKQVLLNLVGNAVKFTPAGGRIELRAVDRAGSCALSVRDTGVGIAAVDLERIFEPFHQADSSTARQHAGTGLGLALVKRWSEAMGGGVELESQVGQGACFTVTLPRQTKLKSLRRSEVKPGPMPDVLVAEDDDATRTMLARVLEAQGCRVRTAVNGQRALEQVMAAVPDVLVLDLMMPELDGYALLEKLRGVPHGEAVPVMVFSASNPQGADRERLVSLGAELLVKGSLTPNELARRIHAVARPARSAA